MDGIARLESGALVALSHAIDAAMARGDVGEAIRLSALQGPELSRWLEAHGYPGMDKGTGEKSRR
jgi:hypothetical protein